MLLHRNQTGTQDILSSFAYLGRLCKAILICSKPDTGAGFSPICWYQYQKLKYHFRFLLTQENSIFLPLRLPSFLFTFLINVLISAIGLFFIAICLSFFKYQETPIFYHLFVFRAITCLSIPQLMQGEMKNRLIPLSQA